MSDESDERGFTRHYVRGLRTSTKNNSAAYGFSIAATASFGMLETIQGLGSILEIFLYVVGCSICFAVVNTIATDRFRERLPSEPPIVVLLGTAFSIVSISAAVGVTVGIAYALDGWPAWLLASFAFTIVYLLAVGVELAIAAQTHELGGYEGERRLAEQEEGAA